jgi:hypothetical protein
MFILCSDVTVITVLGCKESIYLSIYGPTALVDLGRFFSFLIYTQSVRLLGRGISQSLCDLHIEYKE